MLNSLSHRVEYLNDVTKNLSESEEQNDSSSIKLHVSSYINDSVIVVDYFTSYHSIVDIRAQCFHMEVKVAVLNAISQICN